jgi:hypothetical protein
MGSHYNPRIVTDGLVLCLDAANIRSYPGSGTVWTDVSGFGNDGILVNGPTYTSANGGSIVFDGTNDTVEIAGNASNNPSSMTLFCFIYPKNIRAEEIIALNEVGDEGDGYRLMTRVYEDDTGTLWGFRPNINDLEYKGTTVLSDNTWYCLAITYTTSNLVLYLNGNVELNQSNPYALAVENGADISIGLGIGGALRYLQADLPIFMMYNRALTQSEIRKNFNTFRIRFGI